MYILKTKFALSIQLIICAVLTMSFITATFGVVTAWRLNEGAQLQKKAIKELAQNRLENELHIQATLFATILKQIMQKVDSQTSAISERREIKQTLSENTIMNASEILKQFVKGGEVDSAIIINKQLKTIATHTKKLDTIKIDKVLATTSFKNNIIKILQQNNPSKIESFKTYFVGNELYKKAFGIKKEKSKFFIVAIHPIFNNFAKVEGLIIANRLISQNNTQLNNRTTLTTDRQEKLELKILYHKQTVFHSGSSFDSDKNLKACNNFAKNMQICIKSHAQQITNQTQEIIQFIEQEKWGMIKWLFGLCLVAIIGTAIIMGQITHKTLEPLTHITQRIAALAKGNWHAKVKTTGRNDEIGQISKAIVAWQKTAKQQNIMQNEIKNIKNIEKQKNNFYKTIENFRLKLRQKIINLIQTSQTIIHTSKKLNELTILAKNESDEMKIIANKIKNTEINNSINRINDTIDNIYNNANTIKNDVNKIGKTIQTFSNDIKKILNQSMQN